MKFKLEKRGDGNLAEYINANSKYKDQWAGWIKYAKKHAARLLHMQASPRLEPVVEGEEQISINPPLLLRKGEYLTTMSCALAPNQEGVSFAEQYAAAVSTHGKTNLSKTSIEQLVNFHRLIKMEILYLASCDTLWKNCAGGGGIPGGSNPGDGAGGSVVGPSLSILSVNAAPTLSDRVSQDDTAALRLGLSLSSATAAAASSTHAAASPSRSATAAVAAPAASAAQAAAAQASDVTKAAAASDADLQGGSAGDAQADLSDIKRWDHRSGQFPLIDSALEQMTFPSHPRPRYYFAAALILFMRASRTEKEEKVFRELFERWPEWFGEELDYGTLNKGPPRKGPFAYTEAEINWCEVRLQVLDKDISDAADRVRLGLPKKHGNGKGPARNQLELRNERLLSEKSTFFDDAASGEGPRLSQAVRPQACAAAAASQRPSPEQPNTTSPRPAATTAGRRYFSASTSTAREPTDSDSELPAAKKQRRRSEVHEKHARRKLSGGDAGSELPVEPSIPKRGMLDINGRIVSKKDSRPLVAGNRLRDKYKSNYRCTSNTRRWAGAELDMGQAFKLAVWTHHGPHLPVEKNGNLDGRKALFRTAAYYALSMDGIEEEEIMQSSELPDFLFILVSAAKQMRYQVLTEGRVFFGDKVFTSELRASHLFQREFMRKDLHSLFSCAHPGAMHTTCLYANNLLICVHLVFMRMY